MNTLECNGLRGDWTLAEAEEKADFLLGMGRTVHPDEWCDGLILRARQLQQGAVLDGLI